MIELFSAVIVLVIVFASIKFVGAWKQSQSLEAKLTTIPVVPGGLPILGHITEMLKGPPWDIMTNWVLSGGPISRFRFFFGHYIAIRDTSIIKHVFNNNFKNYNKDLQTYGPFLSLLGTGLVTSDGPLWKKQRDLISKAFRVEILEDAVQIAKEAADRLSSKLEPLRGTKQPVEMAEEFRKLTLQVIGQAVLSLSAEESNKVFPELYLPIVEEANLRTWYFFRKYLPTLSNFRYLSAVRQLNSFVTHLIKTRKAAFDRGERKTDILDRILDAAKDDPWNDSVISQLRDEIKTFLFAGHETSSTMMTWTLYQLTQNPNYLDRVVQEIDSLLTADGELPSFEVCRNEFNFIIACEKEALRLYSIVPVVTRVVLEDDSVNGHILPKGTGIVIPLQAVHHDPENWTNPHIYDPDRFFNKEVDPWKWIPFIAGPRNCVGQHFAILETKLVLALLLKKFKFSPAPGNTGERHKSMVPVCSTDNMKMIIE